MHLQVIIYFPELKISRIGFDSSRIHYLLAESAYDDQ